MNKKVFISYSWGTEEHQEWVINLGKRLMSDSVDVELDKWSLKDGHDVHSFMESMVKSNEIFRVIIICDKKYKERADDRKGGVGTETQIITPEIYNDQKQEKFVPIVREQNDDGKPSLPIYLSSRKYIDFSNEEFFEEHYEELLRNILEAPAIPKPKLGNEPPLYITESKLNTVATNSILRTLENQVNKNPEKLNRYVSLFLQQYLNDLWAFQFESKSQSIEVFGNDIINNLKSYRPLREDFIRLLIIITSPDYDLDVDELISFFEKQPVYDMPKEGIGSYNKYNSDNYKIIFQELFIYTIAICLKNKNYKLAEELLHTKYFFHEQYQFKRESKRFTALSIYHQNLENYFKYKYNNTNGFGHTVITNLSDRVKKEDLILADILCYYIGELFKENDSQDHRDSWYPTTFSYNERNSFDFFDKISSARHFEKIKGIFNTKTPDELKNLINKYTASKTDKDRIRFGRGEAIPFLHEVIPTDKIAMNR